MTAKLTSGALEVRRRPHRAGGKGISDLAGRCPARHRGPVSYRIAIIACGVVRETDVHRAVALHHCSRRAFPGGYSCLAPPGRHCRTRGLRNVVVGREPGRRRINVHSRWRFELVRPQPPERRPHGAIKDHQSTAKRRQHRQHKVSKWHRRQHNYNEKPNRRANGYQRAWKISANTCRPRSSSTISWVPALGS